MRIIEHEGDFHRCLACSTPIALSALVPALCVAVQFLSAVSQCCCVSQCCVSVLFLSAVAYVSGRLFIFEPQLSETLSWCHYVSRGAVSHCCFSVPLCFSVILCVASKHEQSITIVV